MLRYFTTAVLAFAAASAIAGAPARLDQAVAAPGLQRVSVLAFDVAYVRPGMSLAGYDRVLIEPVGVQFRENWIPKRTGSHSRLTAQEREQLRAGVALALQRAFVQEVQEGRLKVTDRPGPGVLRVKPHVVELYLTDTGIPTPAPQRVFTVSSGEATLVADVSDSATGEVLARVGDREELQPTVRIVREATPRRITADLEAAGAAWGAAVRDFLAGSVH